MARVQATREATVVQPVNEPEPCECGKPRYLQVVERLVASERRCRAAERALRELSSGDGSLASYVTALQARIAQLEDNLDRVTRRKAS